MKKCTTKDLRTTARAFASVVGVAAVVLLASCGGGGDSASDGSASVPPAAASSPTTPGTPSTPGTPAAPVSAGSTCGIGNFAATALARINQFRAAGANCHSEGSFAPANPLTWNVLLTQSAEAHTQDMVAHNFFSHTGSNGSTLGSRVSATGYAWSFIGENIAAGYSGIDAVMAGWMASDGHCANLMNPSFKEVGLVCVAGTASDAYSNYWTMDLGLPP